MTFTEILAAILVGLPVTVAVTALGMCWAVPFAFVAGSLQYVSRGPARLAVTVVIEFWRSTPVIVLLFAFYYSLPTFGLRLSGITVGALVLGLNIGGYGSQAVRAALQSLNKGQVEAGLALGMRRLQILCLVELPQALRAMTPTIINQFIQLVKATSLVSLITLTDMTFRAKAAAQLSYGPGKVYAALLLVYLAVCYPATILGRWVEKRVSPGRATTHAI